MSRSAEPVVEEAALDWLSALGWTVAHGPYLPRLALGVLPVHRRKARVKLAGSV